MIYDIRDSFNAVGAVIMFFFQIIIMIIKKIIIPVAGVSVVDNNRWYILVSVRIISNVA